MAKPENPKESDSRGLSDRACEAKKVQPESPKWWGSRMPRDSSLGVLHVVDIPLWVPRIMPKGAHARTCRAYMCQLEASKSDL